MILLIAKQNYTSEYHSRERRSHWTDEESESGAVKSCRRVFVSSKNAYVEILTPEVMVLGDGACQQKESLLQSRLVNTLFIVLPQTVACETVLQIVLENCSKAC